MTPSSPSKPTGSHTPAPAKPITQKKSRFSFIWLLPIVTLIIGLGMVYNHWNNQGINIQIVFDTAEGLEVGKTTVKYRNVDIGMVKAIGFSDDKRAIVIDVEIEKSMEDFLRTDSQFWVVRPRIGTEGISGIGTLLSGAYIEIAPGQSNNSKRRFTGLESPPVTPPNSDGMHVTLRSQGGTPLYIGNPVIYRGFEVGKVESIHFNADSREAEYDLFIKAPYDVLITQNTFFWNVGGFSVDASASGINVAMASLETLISGGVEFDVPPDLPVGERLQGKQEFALYESRQSVIERRQYEHFEYALLVEESINGLLAGAHVEYKGIRVGSVKTPYVKLDDPRYGEEDTRIAIILQLEPDRITDAPVDNFEETFEGWIQEGLTAQIDTANLLTGTLKVSLDYFQDSPIRESQKMLELENFGEHKVIPTSGTPLKNIARSVENILAKLESLPLDQTVSKTNRTLDSADTSIASLTQTLEELQTAIRGLQPDSPAYQSVQDTLSGVRQTLKSADPLLNKLNNNPSALIFGEPTQPDQEPGAKGQ